MIPLTRLDLKLAWVPLRRHWGTACLVTLLLALLIALTSVNSSLFLTLYRRPLPFTNEARLVVIGQTEKTQSGDSFDSLTLENFLELRDRLTTVTGAVATLRFRSETLRDAQGAEVVFGGQASPGYFETLGVRPGLGQTFSQRSDERARPRPMLLSHAFWMRRYGGDVSIVGRAVTLNDVPHVIVGVLADGAQFPQFAADELPDYWRPLEPEALPAAEWRSRWYTTYALLNDGVTLGAVQAELDVATVHLRQRFPQLMADRRLVVREFRGWMMGENRRHLVLLLWFAGLLAMAASVNLAYLLLARVGDRRHYADTAAALGGSRAQICRPFWIEHLWLCLLGVALAVPLALGYAFAVNQRFSITVLALPSFDPWSFTVVAVLVCASVFLLVWIGVAGWFRVARAVRVESARVIGGRRHGYRGSLPVLLQVALAVSLLTMSALLVSSLGKRLNANARLQLPQLTRVGIALRADKYPKEGALKARWQEIKRALAETPGVAGVALSDRRMLSDAIFAYGLIDDRDTMPVNESPKRVVRDSIDEHYLALAGLRVLRGRGFTAADIASGRSLMLVSEKVAALYWPGADPVGRRVLLAHRSDAWAEVVGVVQDVESPLTNRLIPVVWRSTGARAEASYNVSLAFQPGSRLTLEALQRIVWSLDPDAAIEGYSTNREVMERSQWLALAVSGIARVLSVVAAVVCGLGIFSIWERRVAASQREIAVRKALGAPFWRVIGAVGGPDLRAMVLGSGVGLGVGFGIAQRWFDGSNLTTAETALAGATALGVIALGALGGAIAPLLRAWRLDPLPLLREG